MNEEFDIVEGLGKGQIDFGRVLMIHLSRVANRGSEDLGGDEIARNSFTNSVKTLERFLTPWLTPDYYKAKENIKKQTKPYKVICSLDEWFDLLGELMKVIRDSDLLPAEDMVIGDDGIPHE